MSVNKIIDLSIGVLEPLIEKEYGENLEFPSKLMFFHTAERILKNLYSLELLTKEISFKTEQGISLVLRNMLSDIIVNSFVINNSKDFNDSDNLFTSLIHSDFKKLESYFKCLQDHEIITEDEFNDFWKENNLDAIKHYVFSRYKKNELKKFPNNKIIFESLVSKKSTTSKTWKKDIIDAYDMWVLLSKYEHIGWNSYKITRSIDSEKIKLRVLMTIKLSISLSGNIFEYLDEDYNPKELLEVYKKINID